MNSPHTPVLLQEVLGAFEGLNSGVIVDCTLGFGGHSEAILQTYPHLSVIGIDKDVEAREFATKRLARFQDRFSCVAGGFGEKFGEILKERGKEIVGVLADIGVSSLQFDDKQRGFSFLSDTLDMRMDKDNPLDASIIINRYNSYELERIFQNFGEIREYKKMASLIVQRRSKEPFVSGTDLSEFLQKHFKNPRIHPATLAFQAIRMEVNNELGELQALLDNAKNLSNAIFALISFHSLEDRMVKNAFKEWAKDCICDESVYKCQCGNNHSKGAIITKKPITASSKEISKNPRARSAKLRIFAFKDSE